MFSVECTWGDGEDVLLSFKEDKIQLLQPLSPGIGKYGTATAGCVGLTSTEARILANQLLEAAKFADELESSQIWLDENEIFNNDKFSK